MSKIEIKTTQNILLFFEPASLGERIGAYLIDALIIIGYGFFINNIISEILLLSSIPLDRWSGNAIFIILFFPAILYPLITESLMQGQTVGKRILKIRVLKIDGYQASFINFFIRWVFGFVELALFGGSIALISVIASKHSQRLGDFAAGTAVITERNKLNISHTILEELTYAYQPLFTQAEVLLFSDNDVQTIKNYLTNALKSKNEEILTRLANKITEISKRKNTTLTKQADFVEQFLKDYNYYTMG
ncbi:RDD family protein [Capnocytophaga sp. G2]|uniref:RDD family protein n=1 Tax=Capnocytophaga sp. G2 TaxID=3110695 RepID=UPI002B471E55|nr:RDD family protein [Capnocytophaga sp. G2]MEB3004087.1 RDD family protein [Capnocytophaga sp. G2]